MEEDQIRIKQMFLRNKIMDAGYDAQVFRKYLEYIKPDQAHNIIGWNMVELEQVVNDFIKLQKQKLNSEQQQQDQLILQQKDEKQINNKIDQKNDDMEFSDFQTNNYQNQKQNQINRNYNINSNPQNIQKQVKQLQENQMNKQFGFIGNEFDQVITTNDQSKQQSKQNQQLKQLKQQNFNLLDEDIFSSNKNNLNKYIQNIEQTQNQNQVIQDNNLQEIKFQVFDQLNDLQQINQPDNQYKQQQEESQNNKQNQNIYIQKKQCKQDSSHFENPELNYKTNIPCLKQNANLIGKDGQNIEIKITNFEVIQGGYFSQNYIIFEIKTLPYGWSVKRRFSDFSWLRQQLLKANPGIIIPPIPGKKKKSFEQEYLKKRSIFLEQMLNSLLNIDTIRNSQIFLEFLYLQNENSFKTKQKEYENNSRVSKVEQIQNNTGILQIEVNSKIKNFNDHFQTYTQQQDQLLNKTRKLCKQLEQEINKVATTIFKIGDNVQEMQMNLKQFNNKVEIGKQPVLEDIFLTLNNLIVVWGNNYLDEFNRTKEVFSRFFKYRYHENIAVKEMIKFKNNLSDQYGKLKEKNRLKKERLFQQGDINKWEIHSNILNSIDQQILTNKREAFNFMCQKDTQTELECRDFLAYLQSNYYLEVQRIMKDLSFIYIDHFTKISKQQNATLSEMHLAWADSLSHLSDLRKMVY